MIKFMFFLIVMGCSSQVKKDYDTDFDFSKLRDYAWTEGISKNSAADTILIEKRVTKAVNDQLKSKGYKLVDAREADFLVSYDYDLSRALDRDGVTTGVGFGFGTGSRSGFGGVGIGLGSGVRYEDVEVLLISIFYPENKRLLWRGYTHENLQTSRPEKTSENFTKAVVKILEKFPPN